MHIKAANEVLQVATKTKNIKTFEWTMIPVDGTYDIGKSKHRKKLRNRAANIPLSATEPLADPRVPTPITDEEARMLEMYLESDANDSEQAGLTNNEADIVPQNTGHQVTEEDDRWLLSLLNETPPDQNATNNQVLFNGNPTELSNPEEAPATHMTPSPAPGPSNEPPNIQNNTPVESQPAVPAVHDPWLDPVDDRLSRIIPLVNESRHIDERNSGRPTPPWVQPPRRRRTIVVRNEVYLVLDELRE